MQNEGLASSLLDSIKSKQDDSSPCDIKALSAQIKELAVQVQSINGPDQNPANPGSNYYRRPMYQKVFPNNSQYLHNTRPLDPQKCSSSNTQ